MSTPEWSVMDKGYAADLDTLIGLLRDKSVHSVTFFADGRLVLDPVLSTKNITQSIVDTASFKVAGEGKTKPLFQSSNGEWFAAQQRRRESPFGQLWAWQQLRDVGRL